MNPISTISFPARPPFSFPAVVKSHGWVQLLPFAFDEASATLTYVDRLSSGRITEYRINESSTGVTIHIDGKLTKPEQAEIAGKVTWMLGLEMDFSEFYALAREEPKLAQVEKKAQGRVLRSPTFFENVVKTILTTNTLWGATRRMTANMVNQFGDPLPQDNSRRAFPTPERLARATPEILKNETRLGYRAPYIHELAISVATGELDLEAFKASDLPTPELRKHLMKIKGIGAYASANLLVLLGRYDFLPVDSWALKVVAHEWHNDQAIGPAEVEAAFEKWGQWKGLAYWFWEWNLTTVKSCAILFL